MSSDKQWLGEEWQEFVGRLLKHRYGPAAYQDVPDRHEGDLGIEGFSTDGCAYQCYAVEGNPDTKTVYERQRDKITADIKKFIENKDDLAALFGDLLIERWVFVVPEHVSRHLVEHATTKAAEVQRIGLPYVANGFRIMVITDDHFAVEREQLAAVGLTRIHLPTPAVTDDTVVAWSEEAENSALINRMRAKLTFLPNITTEAKQRLSEDLIHKYLRGQALLQRLRDDYPAVYTRIAEQKRAREELLAIESHSSSVAGGGSLLMNQINAFRDELEGSVLGVAPGDLSVLVGEAVADWLMRCPLSFPEPIA